MLPHPPLPHSSLGPPLLLTLVFWDIEEGGGFKKKRLIMANVS